MPDWTKDVRALLAGLRLTPTREAEIVEELSVHLDDRYQELIAGGREPHVARSLVLAELRGDGRLGRRMQALRQTRAPEPIVPGVPRRRLLLDLWQDVRYATRMLTRERGFAAAAILTLALGIGANAAIFSLLNATLFQRLPVRDRDSIAYVFNGTAGVFSYPAYRELRDGSPLFQSLAAYGPIAAALNADGETDQVSGLIVTGDFFDVLGVGAAQGRALSAQDDVTPGAHPVAIVSDGLWRRRFGARADIVGHPVLLNGHAFTIVGVLPPGFSGPVLGQTRDLYVPMMMQAVMRPPRAGYSGEMNPDLLKVRTNQWIFPVGRLAPGATAKQASAALTAVATAVDRASRPDAREHLVAVVTIDEGMPGDRAQMIPVAQLLVSVVGAVLLIACVNVANLLLSRATSRRREIAVRLAIGASRWRLVRQLLAESVLLALAGGLTGLGLAWAVVASVRAAPPPAGSLPFAIAFAIDLRVLAFSLGLSIVTGIVFGLIPAIQASRPGLVPALKDDGGPDERGRRARLKKALVVVEVALSLALLITAGLFLRSLGRMQSIAPGFDAHALASAPLNINLLRYTRDQGRDFYSRAVERLQALPGVEAATVARIAPLTGGGRTVSLQVQGRENSDSRFTSEGAGFRGDGRDSVQANVVGPGYFRTFGVPLVKGRDFDATDAQDAPPVVIVSSAFVRFCFPNEEPLGRRISVSGPQGPWREIVGVVADSKYVSLDEPSTPFVYLPLTQNHETGVTLFVRASGDPSGLARPMREAIQSLEPNLPVPNIQTMEETIGRSLYVPRLGAWLIGVFAVLALTLASIGVYGVLAYLVARRTREFGIRMALGADTRAVFGLIVKEGLGLVAIGVAVGLAGAFAGARVLSRFLYGISPIDVATFVGVPLVLAGVALVACLIPARRAMRVDPTEALRNT